MPVLVRFDCVGRVLSWHMPYACVDSTAAVQMIGG